MTPDKNAVMCPCRDNMLLYFVYIHKAEHEREAPEVLSPSLFNLFPTLLSSIPYECKGEIG
jgi:hypothetical protein